MGFLKKIIKKQIRHLLKPWKLLKKWLIPKQKQPPKEAINVQKFGAALYPPILYGTRTLYAMIVDLNVTDSVGGVANENLHVLAVFCVGKIQQIYEVKFDGVESTHPKFAGKFTMEFRMGTEDQLGFADAVGAFNRYDINTSRYPGLVVGYFKFIQDADQTTFNGIPEITIRALGREVYDPRYSGPNPSTNYANPAICLLDYIKDPIWGANPETTDINEASFITVANHADVVVPVRTKNISCGTDLSGNYVCTDSDWIDSTAPRFTLNIILDTAKPVKENMDAIAATFRGFWPNSDGRIEIASELEGNPVFHLNEENLVTLSFSEKDSTERYNRVIVRFTDDRVHPTEREVQYPLAGDPLFDLWLAEDNNILHEATLEIDGVTSPHECLQAAEIAAKSSRQDMTVTGTIMPIGHQLVIGDIISIEWADFGWLSKEFRIMDITYRDDGLVDFVAEQHEDGIYPWSDTEYEDITGGSYLGDPNNPSAPISLTFKPDPTFVTVGTLQWQYPTDAFVRKFLVIFFELSDATNQLTELSRTLVETKEVSIPIFPLSNTDVDGLELEIHVRAISTTGVASQPAVYSTVLDLPPVPADLKLSSSNFEVMCAPELALGQIEPLGTTYNIQLVDTGYLVKASRNTTFSGLRSDTLYTVRAQTVNAFGVSAWKTETVKTLKDASTIIDLIGDEFVDSIIDDVLPELQDKIDELTGKYDARNLIVEAVNDAFEDLDLNQGIIQESIVRKENDRTIAATITALNASFETEQGVRNAQYIEITTAIADEESARVTQYELLSTQVDNNASQISSTQMSLSTTQGALAVQVQRLDVTNGNVSALTTRVNSAEVDIEGNAEAISGIRTAVAGTDSQSQAELILSATVTKAGESFARAYLGVTSVSAGVARVNGILVDGATNAIEFRSDTVLFTDSSGNPSIYFNNAQNRFVFAGDIVASNITGSTLQTAASGFRTVLSPSFPLWIGNGTPGTDPSWLSFSGAGSLALREGLTITNAISGATRISLQSLGSSFIKIGGGFNTSEFRIPGDGTVRVISTQDAITSMNVGGTTNFFKAPFDGLDSEGGANSFDFYASGSGTYGPFTGSHEALINKTSLCEIGDVLCDVSLITTNGISSTITEVDVSSYANDKRVIGAVRARVPLTKDNLPNALNNFSDKEIEEIASKYDLVLFNAIGEGMLNVCEEGGFIEVGDYLTTSNTRGCAMKQNDDIMRSYTVAKSRQDVVFNENKTRQIAVFYYAG